MSQGAFLDTDRSRPLSLGVVIALHAVVLAALIMAKGELLPQRDPPMIVSQIHADPPPPPPNPSEKTKPTARAQESTTIVPLVPIIPLGQEKTIELPPFLPPTPIDPDATGATTKLVAPVLVNARIDPRFAGSIQPPYPASAQRAELQGRVTVRVRIGTDGRVSAVELVSADDPVFFAATREQALRRWRFVPATRDGAATESWQTLTVRFVLNE